MSMAAAYKIAWESPRFWEKENHIYGGISFLKNTVDLVWYPSAKLFSPKGVLISGFNIERNEAGFGKAFGDSAGGSNAVWRTSLYRGQTRRLPGGGGSAAPRPLEAAGEAYLRQLVKDSVFPWLLRQQSGSKQRGGLCQLEKPEGRTYFAGDYLSHLVAWQEGAFYLPPCHRTHRD